MYNDNDTPYWTYMLTGIVALTIGFGFGWLYGGDSQYKYFFFLTMIVLLVNIKRIREFAGEQTYVRSELARVHREDEQELISSKLDVMKAESKAQIQYEFTSEDFSDDAQAIILKIQRQAKKEKLKKINGKCLIEGILKSLR